MNFKTRNKLISIRIWLTDIGLLVLIVFHAEVRIPASLFVVGHLVVEIAGSSHSRCRVDGDTGRSAVETEAHGRESQRRVREHHCEVAGEEYGREARVSVTRPRAGRVGKERRCRSGFPCETKQ